MATEVVNEIYKFQQDVVAYGVLSSNERLVQ